MTVACGGDFYNGGTWSLARYHSCKEKVSPVTKDLEELAKVCIVFSIIIEVCVSMVHPSGHGNIHGTFQEC